MATKDELLRQAIAGLADESASRRALAARSVAALGGPAHIGLVAALRHDPEPRVRQSVAIALGLQEAPESTEGLVDMLQHDPEAEVRRQAAESLQRLKDASSVASLLSALDDTDPEVREQVLHALSKLVQSPDPTICQRVASILVGDQSRDVRFVAAGVSTRSCASKAVEVLTEALSRERDWFVRRGLIGALGDTGDPRALPSLQDALADDAPYIRSDAAEALGVIGDPGATEGLVRAVGDEDEEVRDSAKRALYKLHVPVSPDERLGFWVWWLAADDPTVRDRGAMKLGDTYDPRAVQPLAEMLADSSTWVRAAALKSLGRIGDESMIPVITELWADEGEEPEVRAACVTALSAIEGPEAVSTLVAALGDRDAEVRVRSVLELESAPGADITAALVARLEDPDADVRAMAAAVLGRRDAGAYADRLFSLKDDVDVIVRYEAALALARLGDARGRALLEELRREGKLESYQIDSAEEAGALGPLPLTGA